MSYIYCLLLCIIVKYTSSSETTGELIFANVIYRHGDRTPIDPYPTDPWRNRSFWPAGWGQLTNTGKQQHLELGKFLRNRYKDIISDKYTKEEIYIRSTDVDRTLMSALSNLAGLYPPKDDDVWDTDIPWQPIPVHTTPEKSDNLLSAKKYCKAYEQEMIRVQNSEEFRKINKENAELYKYLTKNTGRLINTIEGVENIYNCLFVEELNNKTLPKWTQKVYPDKMKGISEFNFATHTYTDVLKRFKSGPLLKEMLYHFVNKTIGKLSPDRSLWVYSAHDTTVANFLNTLGVFSYHNPPYCSCVMVELYKVKHLYYVQVFYRNDTTAEPQLMYLPKCGTLCPLDKMLSLYEPVLPVNWELECESQNYEMGSVAANGDLMTALSIVSISLFLILLLVSLVFGLTYWRHHSEEERWDRRLRYLPLGS